MTNAALERLERLSSAPPVQLPQRPADDSTLDEKFEYLVWYAMIMSDDRIEDREFRRDTVLLFKELFLMKELLERIERALKKGEE